MAPRRPHNSTNVRSQDLGLRAARLGLRVLSPRAPELAARYAERLFFTARRHRRPAALASAAARRVPYGGAWFPVWSWGEAEAPAVVLVHGWEGRGSQLAALVDPLVRRGLRVVAFDAPGHGDAPTGPASMVEHALALVSVATALGPVRAVVGHSVGGAATLLATRFGLSAERFALIAPPRSPAAFVAGFARMFELSAPVRDGMRARVERRYGIALSDLDVRADAARLDRPLLVVHDEDDVVVPASEGALLAGAAPRSRLVTTHGLGHRRILRAPAVVDAVVRFAAEGLSLRSFAETLEGELFDRESRRAAS